MKTPDAFLYQVKHEYENARNKFPPMNSGHEGYAVIKEEVEELWDEIKANTGKSPNAKNECVQIAAMAMAYYLEVTE